LTDARYSAGYEALVSPSVGHTGPGFVLCLLALRLSADNTANVKERAF